MAAVIVRQAALCIAVVCLFEPSAFASSVGENLPLNGAFETSNDAPWQRSERQSTWKITTGESNMLRIAEGRTHCGRKTLEFGPTTDAKPWAIFTSQHVNDAVAEAKSDETDGKPTNEGGKAASEPATPTSETIDCKQRLYSVDMQPSPARLHLAMATTEGRDDMLIEGIMLTYGTVVYVSVPTPVKGSLDIMLPYMQPDAVVSVIPGSSDDSHQVSGLSDTYRGKTTNATVLLLAARRDHPGAAIIHVDLSDVRDPVAANRLVQSALLVTNDSDVIIVAGGGVDVTSLHSAMCEANPSWTLHAHGNQFVLKSSTLTSAPPERLPALPSIATLDTFDATRCSNASADVILMTRNQPLQTLAFLDSLATHVTGIHKVWLVQRADDALFADTYAAVVSCVAGRLNVGVVPDDGSDFGGLVASVLRTMSATNVMLAVDEIIWLRPVDLRRAACLLDAAGDDVGAFQLRLGENLGRSFGTDPRFTPLKHSPGIYAYYPRRMRYDFGYVTNVDVLPTSRHPGNLENAWLRRRQHVRSRQWQFVYRHSRLVNNMWLHDGRVAASASPSTIGYELARIVSEKKRKIDVARFAEENKFHANTHITSEVHYTDLVCPLR